MTAFFFAFGCPISYIAAEHVERIFGEIDWVPIDGSADSPQVPCSSGESNRRAGERLVLAARLAERLRLPLVEPENFPLRDGRPAARAAVYAGEQGAGRRFALAALRLAFCGGYDLSDPDVIAEAGEAADLGADAVLDASCDERYDVILDATSRGITARGVRAVPAIRVANRWFEGFDAVPGPAAAGILAEMLRGAPARPGV